MAERWWETLTERRKAHPSPRQPAPRRIMALALALCMALTALPVSAFGAETDGGRNSEPLESTVLGADEYAVVPAGDKLAVWYNDGRALLAVDRDGTLVAPEADPLPVFDRVGYSDVSGDALNAIYTHSGGAGAAVVFGEALDWDTRAVSGVLSQKASVTLRAGDWVFKGGLTGDDTYTVLLESWATATLAVAGIVENTSTQTGSAAVCLTRRINAGSVTVAETGIVRGTSGFGMDVRGPAAVLGRVETMGDYAVAVGQDKGVLAVGGGASIQGAAASIFLENVTTVCAKAGGAPYGGAPLTIAVKAGFEVGQPLVTDLTDAAHAALFSLSAADDQYSACYDAAARALLYQINYYTVTYLDEKSALAPPTDTARYPAETPFGTAAALAPGALTATDSKGDVISFRGWDTQRYGAGTRYQPGDTLPISDNTQLYAQWESTPYAVADQGATAYYKTLADAVAHAPEGGTVKLMGTASFEAALTLDENSNYPHTLTLDLNGKSLDFAKNGVKVTAGYTFTLTGSGQITTGAYTPEYASEFLLWNDGGSLSVEGGELAGYTPVLLHTGGTTLLTGGKFRGSAPSNAIRVEGAGAEETLLGLLGENCLYAPGLVEKNADDTVASLVSLSARYPVCVLGTGAGSVGGTIQNAPEGLTAQLLSPTGRSVDYWPALRREGTGYAYTFSAPAGEYVLRLRNSAEQGLDYPVSVTAGEKLVGQNFDFYGGRRLTAYADSFIYLPGLTALALTPKLEDGQSILVTAGRGSSADVSKDAKDALARAAGQDASALAFFAPWVKTELRTDAGDTAVSFLTAPNPPIEVVDSAIFLMGEANYGYTLYHCAGPDNRVDRVTAVPNAAGEERARFITLFLGRLNAPDEPCVYALAKNLSAPNPSSGGYTLTAQAGEGGRISPSGRITVARNGSKTFTIAPDEGYEIADVLVDGKSVGPVAAYRFEKITAAHTITATFRRPPHPFADIAEGAWYSGAVQFNYEQGLMNGASDTAFAPDLDTTRGMLVTILWRLEGKPEAMVVSHPFTDVPEGAYYADAAAWGAEAGVIEGYGNGKFGPGDPVTREQMALILYRYAGSPATAGTLDGFTDADKAGGYAAEALKWAVEQGVITGEGGGILNPLGKATRAETAAMLMRYLEKPAK